MKDLTTGRVGKLIFQFAVPMLLGNVFQQLYSIIDSIIVGKYIGKEALAAVGASFPIIFIIIALTIGIATGFTIVVAQYFGAHDFDKIKKTIDTMFIFVFVSSAFLTVLGIMLSENIFHLIGLPSNILPLAKTYLNIYLSGLIVFFGFNGASSILRGLGDSKTPLYFLICSTVLNIILVILFVRVFHWGVAGSAVATVIAQALTFAGSIIYLNKYHDILHFSLKGLHFDREIFVTSLKIGLPSGMQQTFVALGMMALFSIVNKFGTNVIAAYSAAYRIDSLASMPAMNFSMALSGFVGQNMGAGHVNRVKSGLRATLLMSSVMSVAVSIVVILFGNLLMSMFTNDPEVVRIGHGYLIIVGCFYLFFSSMFVFNGVLRGAGDTFIPMFITLCSLWLIRIPLAYFLSRSMAEKGIWTAIPIAWFIGMALTYGYYMTGRWQKKVIVKKHK
jgi:putative MATE family efflux protein